MKFAPWNVKTMHHQPGKRENNKKEAARLKVDILGLAVVRWVCSGKVMTNNVTFSRMNYIMFYSDLNNVTIDMEKSEMNG